MSGHERQFALPFEHAPSYGPDFLAAPSNADALAWLRSSADWPQGRLALWGGADSGKTHLLRLWAGRNRVPVVSGPALSLVAPRAPLAIDDADAAPALPLLHTLNAAAEAGIPVLLAGRAPPARWNTTLPDLASRLRSITAVEIGAAEDSLLRALLARLLAERQFAVPEPLQDWILLRIPRTAGAVRQAAARLDHISMLAGHGPTRALAAEVVAAIVQGETAASGSASGGLHANETLTHDSEAASPGGPSFL